MRQVSVLSSTFIQHNVVVSSADLPWHNRVLLFVEDIVRRHSSSLCDEKACDDNTAVVVIFYF